MTRQPPGDGIARDDYVIRFAGLDACTVSDALDVVGVDGVLDGLRPMWEGARVVGRAVTVRLAPDGQVPGSTVHLGATAVSQAGPGSVIVVANEGRIQMGAWGGLLSLAASTKGINGVVVDGACRDVDEARELKFPIFARCGAVRTARGRVVEAQTGGPIEVAGVAVQSGSLVIADGSGVVVVPEAAVDDVLLAATEIVERERTIADAVREGAPMSSVFGRKYEALIDDLSAGHRSLKSER